MTTQTSRLFVSHSHLDDAFGKRLIADLRARFGEDAVWYDNSGGLHGGDAWWDRIVAEITDREIFLVILSPAALESKWVPLEMGIAFRQFVELGKRLLPVRCAPGPTRPDWSLIQEFDFTDVIPYDTALAGLLDELNRLGVLVAPVPEHSRAPAADVEALTTAQRLALETHAAYGRERWPVVLDKTALLIEMEGMDVALWRERGSAALAVGDAETALAALGEALKAAPEDVPSLRSWARALAALGRDDEAGAVLRRALALTPPDDVDLLLPILADLCEILAEQERWGDVLVRIDDALRLAPNDVRWLTRKARALAAAGRTPEAEALTAALPPDQPLTEALETEQLEPVESEALATEASAAQPDSVQRTEAAHSPSAATLLLTLSGHTDWVWSVAWAPNGAHLASGGDDKTVRVWDSQSGASLWISRAQEQVTCVAWAPDGSRLASNGGKAFVQIWETQTGKLLHAYRGITGGSEMLLAVGWAPDGSRLAAAGGTVNWGDLSELILDAQTDKQFLRTGLHTFFSLYVWDVAWSPDGGLLASAGSDRTVRIWHAQTGLELVVCRGHTGYVYRVA